jgi:hypothetical protein
VDISPKCEKQARSFNKFDSVLKIAKNIEKQQSIANLDKHLPLPIVKKVVGKTYRLYGIDLVQEHTGHRVIRFSKFFAKSQNEDYHRRLEEEQFRNKFIEAAALSGDELKALIQRRISEGVKVWERPSEQEAGYLDITTTGLNQGDPSIYETLDWVDSLKSPKMTEFRRTLVKILQELTDSKTKERLATTRYPADRNSRGVLYRQFQNGLLLIAPVGFDIRQNEDELRSRYAEVFNANEALAEGELRKFSLRTYPEFVIWDDNLWVNLQRAGKEANLSLSPEESELLNTLLTPGKSLNPYPLFINGRPGSGKTTILHYLFAEHLHHHLTTQQQLSCPPLYLTYSSALTERAKETVSTILAGDYRRLENPPDMDSPQAQATIGRAFSTFRDMLLSLVGEEARSRFDKTRYVDFPEFRNLWMKSVARSSFPADLRNSPELAWHAIRTFIKGRCPADGQEDDFGPERYAELPKRQKSIDDDLYAKIYKSIWLGWYKTRCEEGRWDDQDLALEVLRQEDGLACYPAIVCDEAQDFTSNELAVILRLSLFSERDVPGHQRGRIPFAFAGDPFQTLNPTGFDWNVLSDSFRENLLRELDPAGRQQLQVNFRELEFNYRSAEPIVRLCNLIQLLRGVLFEVGRLRPQKTWRNTEASEPALFDIGEAATRDGLRNADDVVFIIPSQEETEYDYVKADSELSHIALENGKLTRDVFNPIRAKGMEFGRVVIYKFGDYCLKNVSGLAKLLVKPEPQSGRDRQRLTYEYFLNRLYVALSRACGRLFIVDTAEAIANFWSFARGQGYEDLIRQYNSPDDAWKSTNLGFVTSGDFGAWQEESMDDDADIGRQYFEHGRENRDPYLLERAANRFERARDESNKLKAQAWALHFHGRYFEAGRLFASIPDVPCTLDNYWLAREYLEFVNFSRNKRVASDPRLHAARYMGSHRLEVDARTLFETLSNVIPEKADTIKPADAHMCEVLDAALETLLARLEKAPDDERAQNDSRGNADFVVAASEHLDWKPRSSVGYAVLMALGGRNEIAANTWRTLRRTDIEVPVVLLPALAETAPFPEKLTYLGRLGDFCGILEATRSGNVEKIPLSIVTEIATDMYKSGKLEQIDEFALSLSGAKAFAVFNSIPVAELESNANARELAVKLFVQLAENGQINEFFNCAVNSVQDVKDEERQKWIKKVGMKTSGIHCSTIRGLADKGIDSTNISIDLRDNIEKYFDTLITDKNPDLTRISPFEVGAVLEISKKYTLMRNYYERVIDACNRHTDPKILEFARQRLVFSLSRLADTTKKQEARQSIEKKYRDHAREWGIGDPKQLSEAINISDYREEIERFYDERKRDSTETEIKNTSISPTASQIDIVKTDPTTIEQPPLPKTPIAIALEVNRSCRTEMYGNITSSEETPSVEFERPETNANYEIQGGASHKGSDKIEILTDKIGLGVECDYDKRRIEIRNIKTSDLVTVKNNGKVTSVKSTDFDVSCSENGVYRLGDWPVEVIFSEENNEIVVELQILSGGPSMRLKMQNQKFPFELKQSGNHTIS